MKSQEPEKWTESNDDQIFLGLLERLLGRIACVFLGPPIDRHSPMTGSASGMPRGLRTPGGIVASPIAGMVGTLISEGL